MNATNGGVPIDTVADVDPLFPPGDRPSWRGWMHVWAFLASIPAGVVLVVLASSPAGKVAAAIYGLSLMLLFGTSAAYHRLARTERQRGTMQRIDHAMIYVLIVGTYVPVCLVALPPAWGIPILAIVAAGGALGMVLKLTAFHGGRWISYTLYPTMGWVAVIAAPVLIDSLTPLQLALIVAGGVAYTIGFPVLMMKWPNPWPARFGYHEVWHLLTVVAAGLHFAAVSDVVA